MKVHLWCFTFISIMVCMAVASAQDSLNVRKISEFRGQWRTLDGIAVQDTLAYLAAGSDGLYILSVADPQHPVEIGHCPTASRYVTVSGSYAYLASNNMFSIVDISDPTAPVQTGPSLYLPSNAYITNLNQAGDFVYAVADSWVEGESFQYLSVFDVSDPAHSTLVGSHCYVILYGSAVSGDYLYLAQCDIGFTVCRVEDPFTSIAHAPWEQGIDPLQVAIAGTHAYLSCPFVFRVMDITDPLNPTVMGACSLGAYCGCKMALAGQFAFVADPWSGSGLRIVNVMDPAHPAVSGFYRTLRVTSGIAGQGHYAYLSQDTALVIYDCSAATSSPEPFTRPPSSFVLSAYPNPFNPSTTIRYDLPASGIIHLSVFDLLGREVTTLFSGTQTAGSHEARFDGAQLSSGIYFVRLESNLHSSQHKIVLLK
jgi:hypothetical protein